MWDAAGLGEVGLSLGGECRYVGYVAWGMENGGFFFALCLLLEGRLCSLELQKKILLYLLFLSIYLFIFI